MTRTYSSINEIKQANRELGHHFFDADTMRFFNSRISPTIYGGRYFITSEQMELGVTPRRYSLRRANDDGSIDTVGDFHNLTRGCAVALAREAAAKA